MANEVITRCRSTPKTKNNTDKTAIEEPKKRITLPWIPKVSPKLKSVHKKAGYDVAFKSGKNLGSLLSLKNKSKLSRTVTLVYTKYIAHVVYLHIVVKQRKESLPDSANTVPILKEKTLTNLEWLFTARTALGKSNSMTQVR